MKHLFCSALGAALAVALPSAGAANLDLSRYSLTATYALPGTASESSAITWNWDTDTLFVVGDEGQYITEVSRSGAVLGSMRLSGFDDTEALAYIGNGQFVIGEERIQSVYRLSYQAGATATRSTLPVVNLGANVGNVGLEGVSYDRRDGSFVTVKEKTPQAVRAGNIDFTTGTHTLADLFTPALGVSDLSDVQTLSGFTGSGYADNLLIYSQESQRLTEVSRSGQVLSSFNFTFISGIAEGVTIASDGTIYVTDESPAIYVLTAAPVPEPASYALMLAGAAAIAAAVRRRRG